MNELVCRLRHLVSLNKPKNGGPYSGFAAAECMKAMEEAASFIEHSAKEVGDVSPIALADQLENAARAHKRLGKTTRDDEKTRALRKDCIAAVAEARRVYISTLTAALEASRAKEVGAVSDEMARRACKEYLSHKGERPERVLRGGMELWETCVPAMRAALEASRIPVVAEADEWTGPFKHDAAGALNSLRRSVAEILGTDPETWPDHKNAPLAIASAVALLMGDAKDAALATPIESAPAAGVKTECCSATSPCSWQRHNGSDSVCPTCIAASAPATPSYPDMEIQERLTKERDSWRRVAERLEEEKQAAEARASSAEKALEELAEHKTWELDYGERDPNWEGSECGWRVHERSGNINDREWALIGFGATPREALDIAPHHSPEHSGRGTRQIIPHWRPGRMSRYSYSIQCHKGFWLVSFNYDGGTQGFNEPLGTYLSLWEAYLRVVGHALRCAFRSKFGRPGR